MEYTKRHPYKKAYTYRKGKSELRVVCAWCLMVLRRGHPYAEPTSHSACDPCAEKLKTDILKLNKNDELEIEVK